MNILSAIYFTFLVKRKTENQLLKICLNHRLADENAYIDHSHVEGLNKREDKKLIRIFYRYKDLLKINYRIFRNRLEADRFCIKRH